MYWNDGVRSGIKQTYHVEHRVGHFLLQLLIRHPSEVYFKKNHVVFLILHHLWTKNQWKNYILNGNNFWRSMTDLKLTLSLFIKFSCHETCKLTITCYNYSFISTCLISPIDVASIFQVVRIKLSSDISRASCHIEKVETKNAEWLPLE